MTDKQMIIDGVDVSGCCHQGKYISPSAVWLRTQKGIDIVTAITTPSRTRRKRYDG